MAVKSRRDSHIERMRKKYPDKKFEDDEELFGAISDDYDQYEQENGEYKGREKALSDMFAADPRSAQFLTDMHKGQDPVLGLVRHFGVEIKDVLDDPAKQEEIAQANREYVERVAKSRQLEEEYRRNEEQTLETLRQFQQQRGLSDEQIDRVMEAAIGIVNDGVMGRFSPETLEMIMKAQNYETDLANAAEEGEIAGRNARIEERLRKPAKGDGTNPIGGSNNSPKSRRAQSIFDIAGEAL